MLAEAIKSVMILCMNGLLKKVRMDGRGMAVPLLQVDHSIIWKVDFNIQLLESLELYKEIFISILVEER